METEDGYFLGAHRIPHGRANGDWFVLLGPEKGMGYVLADNGYDVWLCNVRGAIHSRKHKLLNADEGTLFWKFSWHELGLYDLPAMIDYVLNVTNKDKVHYVGHSQGGTSFVVMISERPEYNKKIKIMIGLSPAVFFTKVPNNFYRLVMSFVPILQSVIPLVSSLSTGGSVLQVLHYIQLFRTGSYQKYDYGRETNLRKYGSVTPPRYNLKNVTAPVALFYSENDIFVSEEVNRLSC
ncbi:hypothetical protein NQ318_007875 [Aromia moschata]|uniref:AB hydrolase-1 domain-containing protein n=1 Tax=Aromia moschata TaxID=1265417 RepID=A0AAV8XFL6_9CUCU|nr:hypothetical protein NQ318_007875 [Aromia moschata]